MSLISLTQQDRKECKNKAKRIWQDVSMASDANYATNSRTHAEVMAVHIARVGYNLVAHLCKPDNVGLFWTLFFSFNELLNFEDTK
jgi:hypothetical protein